MPWILPAVLLVSSRAPHTSPLFAVREVPLRIELMMSLIAGTSGGLAGLVWSRLVSTPWLARTRRTQSHGTATEPVSRQVAAAVLFAVAGTVLGFLYWLGWGLISLVGTPWYAAGLLFGGLVWGGVVLPLVGVLALRLPGFGGTALMLAIEWLVTCTATGLSCALAWQRYA